MQQGRPSTAQKTPKNHLEVYREITHKSRGPLFALSSHFPIAPFSVDITALTRLTGTCG